MINKNIDEKKNKKKSNYYEYFTAFDKTTPVSAAIFAPTSAIKLYSKLVKKVWQNSNQQSHEIFQDDPAFQGLLINPNQPAVN